MPSEQKKSRLKAVELAAIDLVITALQAGHRRIDFVSKDDNPREQMAEALAQIHGGVEPTERDQEIIGKIKDLASHLSSRTSLSELLDARAKIVRGN